MKTRPPSKLNDSELDAAERMADEALARCAKVAPSKATPITTFAPPVNDPRPHTTMHAIIGGSCVPPMAEMILALVAEVRELRRGR